MALFDRIFQPDTRDPDEVRMTLGEHLEELRVRLIRSLVALLVGAALCWVFRLQIVGALTTPLSRIMRQRGYSPDLTYTNVTEPFMAHFHLALILGFFLAAPYIIWQIWGFVAAGLYPHERRWVRRFVPYSILLFFVGAIFFIVVVMPIFLDFFIGYGEHTVPDVDISVDYRKMTASETQPVTWPGGAVTTMPAFPDDPTDAPDGAVWFNRSTREVRFRVDGTTYALPQINEVGRHRLTPMIKIQPYLTMILQMAAAFGLGFQVPVVVALLATIGVASSADMARARRYVWFGISIVSAIVTPSPDVTSMMLLFVPMMLLYEVGLLVARTLEWERGAKPT